MILYACMYSLVLPVCMFSFIVGGGGGSLDEFFKTPIISHVLIFQLKKNI